MKTSCGGWRIGWNGKWTKLASREFDEAAAYIAVDSIGYAATFVRRVLEGVELLAGWPDSGPIVSDFDDPSLREIFVGYYGVIYRVQGDNICVVAFVHASRDLARLWRRGQRDAEQS